MGTTLERSRQELVVADRRVFFVDDDGVFCDVRGIGDVDFKPVLDYAVLVVFAKDQRLAVFEFDGVIFFWWCGG